MKRYIANRVTTLGAALALLLVAGIAASVVAAPADGDPVQRLSIEVTSRGFVPATIELEAGVPAELVFTRTTASGCAAQVHVPDLGIEKTVLPHGQAVTIAFTPDKPGTYELFCGMNMFRGKIVVKAAG